MNAVKATVRGGRIELDQPLNLPDGTELLIPLPNGSTDMNDEDSPMSPDEIDRVLAAMEQIQSFDMSAEERAAWEAERRASRDWEKAHFTEYGDKLRRMWDDPIPPR